MHIDPVEHHMHVTSEVCSLARLLTLHSANSHAWMDSWDRLMNSGGKRMKEAGAAEPVRIIGMKGKPCLA